jgi:hypothetical protein
MSVVERALSAVRKHHLSSGIISNDIVISKNNDKTVIDRALSKFGPATARDAVKSAKAVRGRPVKE